MNSPKGHDRQRRYLAQRECAVRKAEGCRVGSDRSIVTVTKPPRALIHVQVNLPGGSLRVEGVFTFGTTQVINLPVVAGAGAFAGARGSVASSQLSGRRALNVYRLRLP